MPCQQPNKIDDSPRVKRWGAQLAKHSAFLSVKSLLFTTALFLLAGHVLVSYLRGRADTQTPQVIAVIEMANSGLICAALYFLIMEYLFRSRSADIRLIHRFLWYLSILFIVTVAGFGSFLIGG
jgi:hypothetical protein